MSARLEAARANVVGQVKVDILSKTPDRDNAAFMHAISRSFISDTVTVPTKEMNAYAALATLGDDVYAADSCTVALEAHMAQLTGKEAALFLPSGAMSNQIALRTHLKQPPYSVLADHRSHIHQFEAGGAAFHSGAAVLAVAPSNGHHLTVADVEANIVSGTDVHTAPTEVIALENTLRGTIIPQDDVIAVSEFAHSRGIKMHLDGARIWHVAAETGTPLNELCEPFDSISLCFSKGLGAPIGSCLVGPKAFIAKARWFRKLFGGGMRQTGGLAASAAYALTHHFPLLPAVHALTRKLEKGLNEIGAEILSGAETNMIFYDPYPLGLNYDEIGTRAASLRDPIALSGSRITVHFQITPSAVDDLLALIRQLADEKKQAGFVKPVAKRQVDGLFKFRDAYVRRVKVTV